MKKTASLILAAFMAMAFCACSKEKTVETEQPVMISAQTEADGAQGGDGGSGAVTDSGNYAFESNDVRVPLGVPAQSIIEALGDNYTYFEAQSCAFQGMDKVYTYPSFLIRTYENDGTDLILSVEFADDTVSTPEGIFIGSSQEQVIAAYGEAALSDDGVLSYPAEGGTLDFIMSDGSVTAIAYNAAT